MDWDHVRVFLAVARAGQFVAGARRLHLDHATASRRVAALEAALGAKLFDRRTTGARLTSAGERFLAAAEQMESAFLHAQGRGLRARRRTFRRRADRRAGRVLDLLSRRGAGAVHRRAIRRLRVQLLPLPQLTPLARREVDIVVGLDKPEAGRFVARKLTDYTLGLYASAAYLDAEGPPGAEFTGHRLIGYVEEYAFSSALDLCARAVRRRADPVGMRERGHAVGGDARRRRPRRGARFHRAPFRRPAPRAAGAAQRLAPTGSSPTRTRGGSDGYARRTSISWRAWSGIAGFLGEWNVALATPVMPALVAGIHAVTGRYGLRTSKLSVTTAVIALLPFCNGATWMAGTSPATTEPAVDETSAPLRGVLAYRDKPGHDAAVRRRFILTTSVAISSFMISLVPPYIRCTRVSRNMRPIGYSFI